MSEARGRTEEEVVYQTRPERTGVAPRYSPSPPALVIARLVSRLPASSLGAACQQGCFRVILLFLLLFLLVFPSCFWVFFVSVSFLFFCCFCQFPSCFLLLLFVSVSFLFFVFFLSVSILFWLFCWLLFFSCYLRGYFICCFSLGFLSLGCLVLFGFLLNRRSFSLACNLLVFFRCQFAVPSSSLGEILILLVIFTP